MTWQRRCWFVCDAKKARWNQKSAHFKLQPNAKPWMWNGCLKGAVNKNDLCISYFMCMGLRTLLCLCLCVCVCSSLPLNPWKLGWIPFKYQFLYQTIILLVGKGSYCTLFTFGWALIILHLHMKFIEIFWNDEILFFVPAFSVYLCDIMVEMVCSIRSKTLNCLIKWLIVCCNT